MTISIDKIKFSLLFIAILFSDILNFLGLSLVTKIIFTISFFLIIVSLKPKEVFYIFCFILMLYFFYIVGFLSESQNFSYFIFPLLIIMGFMLYAAKFNPSNFRTITILFLIINLIAMVYEKLNGSYLLDVGHEYTLIQGQGLFTWTKVQGEFLIAMSLLFYRDRPILFLVLICSLFSGVRAAVIFAAFVGLLSFFQSYDIGKLKNSKFFVAALIASVFFLVPIFQKVYNDYNIERYTSMLDLSSSTYSVRNHVHNLHYDCIQSYSSKELIFGKGEFCAKLYDWGAESTIIHSIEYYGLVFSLFLIIFLLYCVLRSIYLSEYSRLAILFVLIIYMLNWRFGFTYMGIFIWWYLFSTMKRARKT